MSAKPWPSYWSFLVRLARERGVWYAVKHWAWWRWFWSRVAVSFCKHEFQQERGYPSPVCVKCRRVMLCPMHYEGQMLVDGRCRHCYDHGGLMRAGL